jgi:hypothetical protein
MLRTETVSLFTVSKPSVIPAFFTADLTVERHELILSHITIATIEAGTKTR